MNPLTTLITYSDGGARGNPGPAAIGVVITTETGQVVDQFAECIGHDTNNVAEYRAMIKALELAKARNATKLHCFADSQLIIFQLTGVYRIKDARMAALAQKVQSLAKGFESITWKQVPRENPMISLADQLLNQALNKGGF